LDELEKEAAYNDMMLQAYLDIKDVLPDDLILEAKKAFL